MLLPKLIGDDANSNLHVDYSKQNSVIHDHKDQETSIITFKMCW